MMLEHRVGAGIPAGLLLALCACTAPLGDPSDAPSATPAGEVASSGLPREVPLIEGRAELVESGVADEFSRHPQARWVVQVTTSRLGGAALDVVERQLADAGYRRVAESRTSRTAVLRMRRDGTMVLVRLPRLVPWTVEYTVTRPLAVCASCGVAR